MYTLGADLGTTSTVASVRLDSGQVRVIELGTGGVAMPSAVHVSAEGEIAVGGAAARRAATEPDRVAFEFKRDLGGVDRLLGGTPYGAETLTGHLLKSVVERVTAEMGEPPGRVVITHPAEYAAFKVDLLRQAARFAGVPDAEFVTEPVAAAAGYAARERFDEGEAVAVFDFGGGTLDCAVVERTEDGFEVVGDPQGLERLGGSNFDHALFAFVVDRVDGLDPAEMTDAEGLAALHQLRASCRTAKEALSEDTDAAVTVAAPGIHTTVRITRSEFEDLIRPRISDAVDLLERTVASSGREVSKVLLVGGSSRIPLVADMIREHTGLAVALDANPILAIARGSVLVPSPEPDKKKRKAAAVAPAAMAAAKEPRRGSLFADTRRLASIGGIVLLFVALGAGALALISSGGEEPSEETTTTTSTTIAEETSTSEATTTSEETTTTIEETTSSSTTGGATTAATTTTTLATTTTSGSTMGTNTAPPNPCPPIC